MNYNQRKECGNLRDAWYDAQKVIDATWGTATQQQVNKRDEAEKVFRAFARKMQNTPAFKAGLIQELSAKRGWQDHYKHMRCFVFSAYEGFAVVFGSPFSANWSTKYTSSSVGFDPDEAKIFLGGINPVKYDRRGLLVFDRTQIVKATHISESDWDILISHLAESA